MFSNHKISHLTILFGIIGAIWVTQAQAEVDVQAVYKQHCSECHSPDRLGGIGPALLPQNLKRLRKKSGLDLCYSPDRNLFQRRVHQLYKSIYLLILKSIAEWEHLGGHAAVFYHIKGGFFAQPFQILW